ncbi:MAG: glycosyltransferase family 4 protein [Cuspidothrix sp.]
MSEKIRILFAGELHSSHALSWIDLLAPYKDQFEVQGLHISIWNPPDADFPITEAKDMIYFEQARQYLKYETSANEEVYIYGLGTIKCKQLVNAWGVIQEFKPHIIHTLGVFPSSVFFLRTLCYPAIKVGWEPFWIVQARGGSDIALNRQNPGLAEEIKAIFNRCDYFIADHQQNYSLALSMGLQPDKLSTTGSVPGAGGVDPGIFDGVLLPSQKERLILWPKAYNCIQSDGFTVIEGLRLALPYIGDFKLIATAAIPDVEYWFNKLLGDYGSKVEIHNRLAHKQLLDIYRSARVLLAPSLSDGIPNSMYEAMASHTVPILSPIETLTTLFQDKVHTLYAPNLDPPAIAEALILAMNDDSLADSIALTNSAWLPSLAGREVVRDRVVKMYQQVSKLKMSQIILELMTTKQALADTQNQLVNNQNQLQELEKIVQHPIVGTLRKVRKPLTYVKKMLFK